MEKVSIIHMIQIRANNFGRALYSLLKLVGHGHNNADESLFVVLDIRKNTEYMDNINH